MNIRIISRAAIVLALLSLATGATAQDARKLRSGTPAPQASQTFNVSGEFMGVMDRDFSLGGVAYHLAPDAQIYEIGRGVLPVGSLIGDRYVFIAGVGGPGSTLVSSVIVRPTDDASSSSAIPDGSVKVRDSSAPR